MKRILGTVALLLFVFHAAPGAAQEPAFEAGVRAWFNEWKQEAPGDPDIRSDTAILVGPAITARLSNRFFVEGSYLFSASDYEFDEIDATLDRQDADIAAGYLFVPEFGVVAGYRASWRKEEGTGFEETVYGPTLGLRGLFPVNPVLSLYAALTYQFTRFKLVNSGTFRENNFGWLTELGLKYDFTPGFSGALGYRYETNEGENTDVRDTFTGPTLSALFAF